MGSQSAYSDAYHLNSAVAYADNWAAYNCYTGLTAAEFLAAAYGSYSLAACDAMLEEYLRAVEDYLSSVVVAFDEAIDYDDCGCCIGCCDFVANELDSVVALCHGATISCGYLLDLSPYGARPSLLRLEAHTYLSSCIKSLV